jgi:hypothetical protein
MAMESDDERWQEDSFDPSDSDYEVDENGMVLGLPGPTPVYIMPYEPNESEESANEKEERVDSKDIVVMATKFNQLHQS